MSNDNLTPAEILELARGKTPQAEIAASAQDQLRALDARLKAEQDDEEFPEVIGLTIRGMTAHTAGTYPEILKAQLEQAVAALLANVDERGLLPIGEVYMRIDVETMARRP